MANTLNLGTDGNWATKEDSLLAYNSENGNFKPLAFNFTRASSATVVNKAGLIETVGSGEPRIDFSNDAKGALLLEPTRSNNLLQSNQFDTTWIDAITTKTSGYLGLDGTNSAWLLTKTASSNANIRQNITFSGTHTFSVYLKKGTFTSVALRSTGGLDARVEINLIDGTTSGEINTTSVKTESVGNDWWRCSLTFEAAVNTAVRIYPDSVTGTTAGDIYIWGAQLEQGSYATSYIPTQGSAVTRNQDSCLGQIIGYDTSSSFSLFFSFGKTRKATIGSTNIFSVNTTSGKDIYLYTNSSGNDGLNIYIENGGNYPFGANQNNGWNAEQSKICITYDISTSRFAYFINGSLYGYQTNVLNLGQTDYTSIIPNNNIFEIREHKFYTNALTDSEAITLTSL